MGKISDRYLNTPFAHVTRHFQVLNKTTSPENVLGNERSPRYGDKVAESLNMAKIYSSRSRLCKSLTYADDDNE